MPDDLSKIAAGAAEGAVKATFQALQDLVRQLGDADKKRTETLLGWIKAAQLAVKGLGQQGQEVVLAARRCDMSEGAKRDLKDRLDAHMRQDKFRPELLSAIEAIGECIGHLRARMENDKGWWPFWAKADKAAVVDQVEESLREFQTFLTGLSTTGAINPTSGFPFVMPIADALEKDDANAMEKAVQDALRDPRYVEWMVTVARAEAAATAVTLQFR